MKRILALVLLLGCALLSAVPAHAASLAIAEVTDTLFEGDTVQLTLLRSDASVEGDATWSSSSAKLATVDENGLVTCVGKGTVTITARVGKLRASIRLTVNRAITGITLNTGRLTEYAPDDPAISGYIESDTTDRVLVLKVGTNAAVSATVTPNTASSKKVTMTVSDPEIVKISGNTLIPQRAGECDLTVAGVLNPEVSVTRHLLVLAPVTKLEMVAASKTVFAGERLQLDVSVTPADASDQRVTWKSSNASVATVDANGLVTGIKKGTATITATAMDGSGKKVSMAVTVQQKPESVTLNQTAFSLAVNRTQSLRATVLPSSANDKKVTWSTSDATVATVTANGQVKGIAPGTAVITCASAAAGEVSATATVTVYAPVTKLSFLSRSYDVKINESISLGGSYTVEPANATDPTVTFSSNKPSVATVDPDGTVHAVSKGTATITITANDGSKKKATTTVNVIVPVTGVWLSQAEYRVGVDESISVTANILPSNASNKRVIWSVGDTTMASASGTYSGTITGKRWGTTTITCRTQDGGYTASATLQVGNYNYALRISDLQVAEDNQIRIVVHNDSNMTVSTFYYDLTTYDLHGYPLTCSTYGTNMVNGYYLQSLYENSNTIHGRYHFANFVQPTATIGRVEMVLTGYVTDSGYSHTIPPASQITVTWTSPLYATPTPKPTATPTPSPTPTPTLLY